MHLANNNAIGNNALFTTLGGHNFTSKGKVQKKDGSNIENKFVHQQTLFEKNAYLKAFNQDALNLVLSNLDLEFEEHVLGYQYTAAKDVAGAGNDGVAVGRGDGDERATGSSAVSKDADDMQLPLDAAALRRAINDAIEALSSVRDMLLTDVISTLTTVRDAVSDPVPAVSDASVV